MEVIETVADSIAIKILNENNILTGKGNELFLYSSSLQGGNKSGGIAKQKRVNIQLINKVHGICQGDGCNKEVLLVYGEKEFLLLQYESDSDENSSNLIFKPEFFRGHLSDWISCGSFIADGPQLVLCTAHSVILRFEYDIAEASCILQQRVTCVDKSTLYCSYIFGGTWSELVVFGGNAFGELLVWQPAHAESCLLATSKYVELLHRVAAHNGVIFSIDYDEASQQLITTSDDRAVKWWKVKFDNGDVGSWKTSKLLAVASGFGHVARVFQGRIIKDGNNTFAISTGEDSYFCVWRNNGELLYKRRQQFGATIWNFDYHPQNQTIYTVGSTGNLNCYGLKSILQSNSIDREPLLLPQVSEQNVTEYIAKVKFLNQDNSLVMGITNYNRLLWCKIPNSSDDDPTKWKWMDSLINIPFKCTVLEVCLNRIAVCGFKRMHLIDWNSKTGEFKTHLVTQLLQGVIRTFVFFTTPSTYLVCDDKGSCLLFSSESASWMERSLQLPNCKEPWLTTALLLNKDRHLIASNRQGNLLLYLISNEGNAYKLTNVIKHPHGNLGSTVLQLVAEKQDHALVRSTGHDGAINLFKVNFSQSSLQRCQREIIPVSWVEHIARPLKAADLFLGFNDNHFVLWCKEYDFLEQLPCGGGHRCWHFQIDAKSNEISLVFVKNKRILFYNLPLYNKEQLSLPPAKRWHNAPCNKLEILEDSIAVSAGDDNLIKIHSITQRGLLQKQELHQHISNVRALRVKKLNAKEFLIFSGGGRGQLCITKVNKIDFLAEELISQTVGKMEEDTKQNKEYNFDPETRLMSLDVQKIKENVYDIFIGCSDGFIRVLNFNLDALEIYETKHYFYGRCLLHIELLAAPTNIVLAAATDGFIRIFDRSLEKCLCELKHHSSGVNALSTFYDPQRQMLKILTGGDDQAVAFTELCLISFRELNNFHKPFLHTAQVCAAAISRDGCLGYTSGVDQNVYKLNLSECKEENVLQCFHSCVADIKGLALTNDKGTKCFIYGCGLQIISI